jgi:hypothetical protein
MGPLEANASAKSRMANNTGRVPLPMPFAILKFTDVFVPIGIGGGALPVLFVILNFTDVCTPIGPGIGALFASHSCLHRFKKIRKQL